MIKTFSSLALVFAFSSLALAGGGGSGVRNSGHGLFCNGKEPRMVDTFLLETSRFKAPHTYENLKIQVRQLFDALEKEDFSLKDIGLGSKLILELERLGASEDWKKGRLSQVRSHDEYLPFDLSQAPDCKIKQISSFDDETWRPIKVQKNYKKLSDFERRVLELHEAFYILGARDYGHTNPARTRELVSKFFDASGNLADIRLLLHAFVSSSPKGEQSSSVSRLLKLNEPGFGRVFAVCPQYLAIERLGVSEGLQIALLTTGARSNAWEISSFTLAGRSSLSSAFNQHTRYDYQLGDNYNESLLATYTTGKFEVSFHVRPFYFVNEPSQFPSRFHIRKEGQSSVCDYSDVALSEKDKIELFRSIGSRQLPQTPESSIAP